MQMCPFCDHVYDESEYSLSLIHISHHHVHHRGVGAVREKEQEQGIK